MKNILKCENTYIKYFCEIKDEGDYIRYTDNELKDMYDHNFIELKSYLNENKIKDIVLKETEERKPYGFCKIKINQVNEKLPHSFDKKKPEVEHIGVYVCNTNEVFKWNELKNYNIKRISNEDMINEIIEIEIALKDERCPKDFCIRRAKREAKVYIEENSCNAYMCYYNGVPVGYCVLTMDDETAKIEDLVVHPNYQRKGIGTTILKESINKAISKGAKTVYLNADEDDTPKEMYLKLGFKKVNDLYYLFWLL